ncbi:MAG: glycosyltransferase family 39 protein [Thermoguttaceae bacterium]|jgi:hypothetical protein|nr:glycosyltransferase family 39 protein [Thermoguttaceae bacterium]
MANLLTPFQPAPDEYPNGLATPQPQRATYPRRAWLLVGLVLLCLVPRALMALRVPSVVSDGALYIQLAKSLEAGDYRGALGGMSLNTYPVILMALHRAGLDWETAGKWWGVAIASLVVLPLFGWARRQFDDRIAVIACVLYAFHPKLIAWSPEVIRDSTFWFLFMLSLYLLWRSITEVRLALFAAAGPAVCLAAMTRFEGVFLAVPLVLWSFWRWRALTQSRARLALGLVICVLLVPGLLLLVNFLWLQSETIWRLFRVDPFGRAWTWLQATVGRWVHGGQVLPAGVGEPLSFGRMVSIFFPTMTRGLSPIFALLMFGGMWGWRRVWGRRDHQALFYTGLVVLAGIWIQLWYDKFLCPRYALTIVLFATVFAALGLLGLTARVARLAAWFRLGPKSSALAVAMPLVVACGVGLADAMTSSRPYFAWRKAAVELGHWAQREFPTPPSVVGPAALAPIVSYYADASRCQVFRFDAGDPAVVVELVKQHQPDLLLVQPTRGLSPEKCRDVVQRVRALGLEPVRPERLPQGCAGLDVLIRMPTGCRLAARPGT